ncbi:MAG TPA: alkaline phosphatase family protein [Polyangia bacterium]|nr:alkaline phosphatase family protein [Polyangia bacterium]
MRDPLFLSLFLASTTLAGCGGGKKPAVISPDMDMPDMALARSTLTADQAAAERAACTFTAGTQPGLSIASDAPLGNQIPIDTVVIVMMENRSFDHLLQALPAYGQPDADVAPANASNLDSDGTVVNSFHLTPYCFDDPNHGWKEVHNEWDNGAMDGFVIWNNYNGTPDVPADGKRAMGYYTDADLPWLYSVANTFALADRNFSSLLGPTFPNREFLYAGTSFGHTGNAVFTTDQPTIMQALNAANVDWREYATSLPGLEIFAYNYLANIDDHQFAIADFYTDAAAGKLGQVNFVDPDLYSNNFGERNDFHPPGDIQGGQAFMHDVVDAVMKSPQWPHAAVILTFDEHGGIYDHVPPPPACAPDDIPAQLSPGDPAGDFKTYGVRVPMIVVSPYAKPHFVSHTVFDHTSILRFIETRFGMPALTARDANADPLSDMFDFTTAAFATPPTLPPAPIDPTKLADCLALYPEDGGTDAGVPTDLGSSNPDGGI